jgi:cellulose biosynthesis protein BcsQ
MAHKKNRESALKIIAFYHLKGGVGKTAAAVNLAWLAASRGYRTLLWDLDPQAAASWYLQSSHLDETTFTKCLKGKQGISAVIQSTNWPELDVIPGGLATKNLSDWKGNSLHSKVFEDWLDALSETYSLIVFDMPPNLDALTQVVMSASERIYVPLIPTPLSMNALETVIDFMQQVDAKTKRIRPFFSMVDRRKKLHCEFLASPPIKLRKQLEGYIPYCADVEKMGVFRQPLPLFAPKSPATLAYTLMWEQMESQLWKIK